MNTVKVPRAFRAQFVLLAGALLAVGCDTPATSPEGAELPTPRFMGKGKGGGGGGGGNNTPEPSAGILFRVTTTAGLANAIKGDWRGVDGSTSATGDSRYQDGKCGMKIFVERFSTAGGQDTIRVSSLASTMKLRKKDPCVGGLRDIPFAFPDNPIFSNLESMANFQWKWEPDAAPANGNQTDAFGKINIRNQPDTFSPPRYNPLRDDGKFVLSDFITAERIEGGWRLFTDPSPDNAMQCEDKSNVPSGEVAGTAGETIPLDFEFFVDENVGDGLGPMG